MTGNLELDTLPISDAMRTVALEGQHPDNPDRYKGGTDRSAALYAVLGAAAVAGADEDILRSICFLPGPLGEHTREQTDPEKYVDRQVEKAVANLKADPDLERLNARHAVVADEGKVLVVNFERDTRGCQKLTWSSFSDFRNRYLNQWKLLGNRSVSLAKWWLTHPRRQQYEGVVFAPDKDVPGYLNYWHGFAVERQAGDWSLLRKHIPENICCGDQELEAYLLGWMALAVQKPGQQGEVAVVLRGGRGTGKGVLAREFGALFGTHFLHFSHSARITGRSNAEL